MKSTKNRIIYLLETSGKPLRHSEIQEALNLTSGQVSGALRRELSKNTIYKVGRGLYAVSSSNYTNLMNMLVSVHDSFSDVKDSDSKFTDLYDNLGLLIKKTGGFSNGNKS